MINEGDIMRIGLFDSGVGGLTVLKTLLKKYPNNEYIYYGDTLNLPYGTKSKEELLKLARDNVDFLIDKKVDLIIIACGTVSSNCLNELKESYNIPIMSIVDDVINYLNNSNYNNIGVIATNATINSHIFKNNINKNVYEIATPKLVPLIENNNLDSIKDILHSYLDDYLGKLDVLVLGCTHYPIISNYIKSITDNIELIDMSEFISINNDDISNKIEIYFSKLDDTIKNNTKSILGNNSYNIKIKQ